MEHDLLITGAESPIGADELAAVELRFGFKFPDAVREHYLRWNGGRPNRTLFSTDAGDYSIDGFLPIRFGKHGTLEESFETLRLEQQILPPFLVPFAFDPGGDYFCFGTAAPEVGTIYFFRGEYLDEPERAIVRLAPSLDVFLRQLVGE